MAKKAISLRVDMDVLNWFKAHADTGYQTLIHDVLEKHVDEKKRLSIRNAGRAQELFKKYHAKCFWSYKKDLIITEENIDIVINGLKKHGGRSGLKLAEELCQ
jgi:hypothetical protein